MSVPSRNNNNDNCDSVVPIADNAPINNNIVPLPDNVNVIFLNTDYIRNAIKSMIWLDKLCTVTFAIQTVFSLNYLPVIVFDKIARACDVSENTISLRCNFFSRTAVVVKLPTVMYVTFKKQMLAWLSSDAQDIDLHRRFLLNHPAGIRYEFTPGNSGYKVKVPSPAKESLTVPTLPDAPKKRKFDEAGFDAANSYILLASKYNRVLEDLSDVRLSLDAVHSAYKSTQYANKLMTKRIRELENAKLPIKPESRITAKNTAVNPKKKQKRCKSFVKQTTYFPVFKEETNNNNNAPPAEAEAMDPELTELEDYCDSGA
jgi:hypothetical protein